MPITERLESTIAPAARIGFNTPVVAKFVAGCAGAERGSGAAEGCAGDVLHDQKSSPASVKNASVGMVQRTDGPDLAAEAGEIAGVHSLDGDETVAGFVDRSHASFADLLAKLIGPMRSPVTFLVDSCGNPGSFSCLRPDDYGLGGA